MITHKPMTFSKSTPTFTEFSPEAIPYQDKVLDDMECNLDYSLGTHEILLSGSVGCLREDALIETVCGKVPISDIKKSDYLLSFDHSKNLFCFSQGSDAFPKGKANLYRVISEHGEFVSSGNHHISSLTGDYLSIESIFAQHESIESLQFLGMNYLSHDRKSSLSNVLRLWKTTSSLIYHYAEHIHQYDQQLLSDLNIVLNAFPLQDDALKYDQFFCLNKFSHKDDLKALELKHAHTFEQYGHKSMRDLIHLLENKHLASEDPYSYSKLFEHNLYYIQSLLLSEKHVFHPIAELFFLTKLCIFLNEICYSWQTDIVPTKLKSIERLSKEEWYWDIQVPNTNNYVSTGMVHHNSAKSILMAHALVKHCMQHSGAKALIGRRALPDLRDTLFTKIAEHLADEHLIDGYHYKLNFRECRVEFPHFGSEIIPRTWADGKFTKLRSLELSAACIEELTENKTDDAFRELKMRVGRLPHIKQNFIMCATNPDSPSHWAYNYFIESNKQQKHPTRHVYYSVTTDNPYLPSWYIEQLKSDLDPKQARRMVYGEWIEIAQDVIYHSYKQDLSFRNYSYKVDSKKNIIVAFDFNIGKGKPMSVVFGQEIDDTYHWFQVVAIEGTRTEQILEECQGLGLLDHDVIYEIYGDATGDRRDTRSLFTDYDIIKKYFSNYKNPKGHFMKWTFNVPQANPSIRTRHNIVNGYCLNSFGKTRFFVYKDAALLDVGMRLTSLKEKGSYIEDDSKEYQHCTTAIGYAIVYKYNLKGLKPIGVF